VVSFTPQPLYPHGKGPWYPLDRRLCGLQRKIIHQKLAYKYGLLNKTMPYYKYIPNTILENETIRLYWDRSLITDKTIHNNRPDITLVNKVIKTVYFIDIAIPNNHNLKAKYADKLAKYSELSIEIKDQWKMDTVATIPVTLSTTTTTTTIIIIIIMNGKFVTVLN
jgi:hypothetical protein